MALVACVFCQSAVTVAPSPGGGSTVPCPKCRRVNEITVFPSLLEVVKGPPPLEQDPPAEGEAACFYNPARRATKSCSHCGVLISNAWAAQWGNETVCLKCLEHLRDNRDERFQSKRTLWDNVALLTAVIPFTLFLWFSVFITAPATVFLALWHWNSPRSMVPRGRFRLVLALVLSLGQITAIVFGISQIWFKSSR